MCPLPDQTCTCANKQTTITAESGDHEAEIAEAWTLSELGVLSGANAGLPLLFQAAAVDRQLLGDASQGIWTNQVPRREKRDVKNSGESRHMGGEQKQKTSGAVIDR